MNAQVDQRAAAGLLLADEPAAQPRDTGAPHPVRFGVVDLADPATIDILLDPFGGSGTTFAVCERKRRRWLGIEIDFAEDIISRLEDGEIYSHRNNDHVEDD